MIEKFQAPQLFGSGQVGSFAHASRASFPRPTVLSAESAGFEPAG